MDKIKLVSERDPKEIAAQRARQELGVMVKELAANGLRIIAGAGKSAALIDQITSLIAANDKLVNLTGNTLASEIAIEEALRCLDWHTRYRALPDEVSERWDRDGTTEVERTEDKILQAALRMVAAQLCDQRTQESRSKHELLAAIRDHNEAWDEHRRLLRKPT